MRLGDVMRSNNLVLVAAALAAFGLSSCGSSSKVKGDLSVTTTPTGEVDGPLKVVMTFSHPMVAGDRIGEIAEEPLVRFVPEIEGQSSWQDEKTLVFIPSENLPVSTGFIARVPKGTKSLDGKKLGSVHAFKFSTERLSGTVDVVGSTERAAQDQLVKLHFNHEVPFEQVERHCRYVSKKGKQGVVLGPDSDPGPGRNYSLMPASQLAKDTDWELVCATEMRGSEGNLGMADEAKTDFRTHGPLRFIKLKPDGNDVIPDESIPLEIAFTNPLKPPYKMSLSPKVRGFPERCHSLGDAPPGVSCGVTLDPRTSYELTIEAEQGDIFGQSLGKKEVLDFRTTDAEPTISMDSGYFVAELKRAVLPVWTRNVKKLNVTALKVTPQNFHKIRPNIDWWDNSSTDFGKVKTVTKKVKMGGKRNRWNQHEVDPATLVGAQSGPGMYYVEIGSDEVDDWPFEDDGVRKTLVNFTDIGVVSKMSPSRGLVWATRLSTGEALPGAQVSVRDSKGKVTWTGRTDAEGIAMLPGEKELEGKLAEGEYASLRVFVADKNDWTMLDPSANGGTAAWNFNVSTQSGRTPQQLRGFMHTDRGLYRPGEKVHIKGLARVSKLGSPLQVPKSQQVAIEVSGPRGTTMHQAKVKLSKFGGFWTDIELGGDARLGDYTISAKLKSGTFRQQFAVEEYRPATFEVEGTASAKRVVRRGKIKAKINASYFYGAPLREGDVEVTVHSRPRNVSFKEFDDFDFIDERKYDSYYSYSSSYSQSLVTEDSMALDHEGNASLAVSVSPSEIDSDADLLVRASVTAPSNEVINKTFTIPYFRSRRYFGIKAPGYFMEVKKKQKFEVVGVAPGGKAIDGDAKVKVTKRDWNCVWEDWGYRGSYQCKENTHVVLEQTLKMVGGQPASFEFTPDGGGSYWVVVEGLKDNHAAAAQRLYAWGDGGGSWRSDDSMTFDLIADKKEYKAGDTATLILKTDLAKAKGLVTIERDGVIEKRFIDITPTMKHIQVPITGDYAPNVYVSVALGQGRMGKGRRGKPRMRMGLANLPVRPEDNTLKVSVKTDKKDYRPGKSVSATVHVTDANGKPVSAEVALTAADEGVLSLIGYKTPNPVPAFYSPWGIGVSTATQYSYIKDIPGPNAERPATGGDSGGPGSVRSRFMSTAVWKPGIVTNSEGVAKVEFMAPDNLTAFRVMAVAADKGYRFGSTDQRFTVSKPLQLHRVLPRFLTLGDSLQGGVVVHNETGKAGTATVTMKSDDLLALNGESSRQVQVPSGGRVPVLFPLKGVALGTSELTFSVKMSGEADAVQFKLPVHHPSPERKAHVAHGASKDEKTITLKLPANALVSSAEVHVSVDRDGLAGIEDGLRDLIGYPYGCLEQTTSKVIPMIAVRGLAEGLNIDALAGDKLDEFVKAGIAKIGRHQTSYGGFSLWPGGQPSAYYTAYALWGLYLAKEAGYKVDQSRIDEGLSYLSYDGKRPDDSEDYYSHSGNLGNQSFALYVRAMLGSKDTQAATELHEELEDIPLYGKAFLARALAADLGAKDPTVVALVKELSDFAAKTTTKGKLMSESDDDELYYYMSSSMRTTAIVLDALLALDPKNEAIKPMVGTIMKKRRGDRYMTTQANIYGLLALDNYASTLSGKTPSVTVSLGDQELLKGTLKGKDRIKVASALVGKDNNALVIRSKGEVHYNIELRYRQQEKTLKAESNGLSVKREYLDEKGQPNSFSHLMVSDRLPAGFEALNTRLKTVGVAGVQQTRQYWGGYREMRDDRVDFSTEYSWRSTYVREYMMRAIAEGRFAAPPTHAELMYEPEKNAQTAIGYIDVKAK
jgi:uncharacterized protein YfaS (alpha-2-macroglobulin family)